MGSSVQLQNVDETKPECRHRPDISPSLSTSMRNETEA